MAQAMAQVTVLNVQQELNTMKQCTQEVDWCTAQLGQINEEYQARGQNMKMNVVLACVTVYGLAASVLRQMAAILLPLQYYCLAAAVSAVVVYLVCRNIPTTALKRLAALDMVIVVAASLCPILPDLPILATGASTQLELLRLAAIPLLAVAWIATILHNYQRKSRIWKMWERMEGQS